MIDQDQSNRIAELQADIRLIQYYLQTDVYKALRTRSRLTSDYTDLFGGYDEPYATEARQMLAEIDAEIGTVIDAVNKKEVKI